MPKRIQLPDDFYKHDFKQLAKVWYGLSDEALEKQIARDLMFRRFIDLSLSEVVPEHATIWRFRQSLHIIKL
jgi:IS5 family transposase